MLIIIITSIPFLGLGYLRMVAETDTIKIWWRVFAGIFLFMSIYVLLRKFNIKFSENVKKFLDFTDAYTYDVYITHHIYILGPFSMMNLTHVTIFNYSICIGAALISAYLLFLISQNVMNYKLKTNYKD